ncbi:MAG: FAD-dependent monooxygenase [Gammaproteobacteria bacterium]|nr:FAD-dependent monooxygenase [Gammaproteobacteria bacterium]
MTKRDEPILIAGGGIGGLTLALALLRVGRQPLVLERARLAGEVGAGLSLGTSPTRGLYWLGLRDQIQATAEASSPSAAHHYATGERLGGVFQLRRYAAKDLTDTFMIHRADFHKLLLNEVEALAPDTVRFGCELVDFEDSGDGIVAKLANGEIIVGSGLVGCDGLRSRTRSLLIGDGQPRFTGRVAYRFLVPIEKVVEHMSAGPNAMYVGPAFSLLRYTIRRGTLVNCVAFAENSEWKHEGWNHKVSRAELMSLFSGWHEDVAALASNAPLDDTAKWALFDRDPIYTWSRGRVTLLGDAAHPLLPFLGMGAGLAIEDAVVLGRLFANPDPVATIFARYQELRRERAARIQIDSTIQGEILSLGEDAPRRPSQTYAERMQYDPASVAL